LWSATVHLNGESSTWVRSAPSVRSTGQFLLPDLLHYRRLHFANATFRPPGGEKVGITAENDSGKYPDRGMPTALSQDDFPSEFRVQLQARKQLPFNGSFDAPQYLGNIPPTR
jgi:hypothetical protein